MSLISLFQDDQIAIIADDEKRSVMLELNSSGYRPRYVTVHLNSDEEIDKLIEALSRAREYLKEG